MKILNAYGSDEQLNRKSYVTLVFSKDTKFRLLNAARAAGIEPPTRTGQEAVDAFCQELVGCNVYAKLKRDKTPDGKEVARVDYFLTEDQIESSASNNESTGRSRRAR